MLSIYILVLHAYYKNNPILQIFFCESMTKITMLSIVYLTRLRKNSSRIYAEIILICIINTTFIPQALPIKIWQEKNLPYILYKREKNLPYILYKREKNSLYTISERRHATPMFFYSPRPEVFAYRGLNNSIANFSLGYW